MHLSDDDLAHYGFTKQDLNEQRDSCLEDSIAVLIRHAISEPWPQEASAELIRLLDRLLDSRQTSAQR